MYFEKICTSWMKTLLYPYPPVSSHLPKLEHVFVPSPSLEQAFLKVHLARDGPEPITKNLATLLSDLCHRRVRSQANFKLFATKRYGYPKLLVNPLHVDV